MVNTQLIKILADGRLHSGQDLASALGVSRTAVWKQLSQLEEHGLRVNRLRGQGYCFSRPLDLLEVGKILQFLSPCQQKGVDLHLFDSVPSTNDYLSHQPSPETPFAVCIAEQQTAGKGRRGRPWQSPFARNIYLSLAYESIRGVSGLDGLSLVIGLAVVKSLESLNIHGLKIKWPNDIWLKDRKLAGILVELSGELQTRCRVVVGLGLNVYMGAEDNAVIDQPWSSLAQFNAVPEGGRNRLVGQLLRDLMGALKIFEEHGFAAFHLEWDTYDALRGRQLYVVGQETTGVGAGIDESGAYRLQAEEEIIILNAGEVSIRTNEAK